MRTHCGTASPENRAHSRWMNPIAGATLALDLIFLLTLNPPSVVALSALSSSSSSSLWPPPGSGIVHTFVTSMTLFRTTCEGNPCFVVNHVGICWSCAFKWQPTTKSFALFTLVFTLTHVLYQDNWPFGAVMKLKASLNCARWYPKQKALMWKCVLIGVMRTQREKNISDFIFAEPRNWAFVLEIYMFPTKPPAKYSLHQVLGRVQFQIWYLLGSIDLTGSPTIAAESCMRTAPRKSFWRSLCPLFWNGDNLLRLLRKRSNQAALGNSELPCF